MLKKIIAIFMAVGIVLLNSCKSQSDENSLQNTSYIGSEQNFAQNKHAEPEQPESSSKQEASESDPEQNTEQDAQIGEDMNSTEQEFQEEETDIYIEVGKGTLTAVLENNESVRALKKLLGEDHLTISASNYGGFEKVCSLGTELPRNDSQITTNAGDICLYNGNQIVIFYGSNSWSYTRLGKISNADKSELEKILSGDETEITLFLKPFN